MTAIKLLPKKRGILIESFVDLSKQMATWWIRLIKIKKLAVPPQPYYFRSLEILPPTLSDYLSDRQK